MYILPMRLSHLCTISHLSDQTEEKESFEEFTNLKQNNMEISKTSHDWRIRGRCLRILILGIKDPQI